MSKTKTNGARRGPGKPRSPGKRCKCGAVLIRTAKARRLRSHTAEACSAVILEK